MTGTLLLLLATLASPDAGEAKRRLETRVTVDLKAVTVEDVVEAVRPSTGLSFVLHPRVSTKADVTIRLRNVPAKVVLKRVLEPRGLKAVWRDGVVLIVPRDRATSNYVVRIYDTRALQLRLPEFPGPKVELASSRGGGPMGVIG